MIDREIESLFWSDVADKKSLARSAQSASRTSSALKKYGLNRNIKIKKGSKKDIMAVNMYKYIPWKKLRELPEDLQEEYFQNIVDKYNIWANAIGRLWKGEVSSETVRQVFIKLGIVRSLPLGVTSKPSDIERFLHDYKESEDSNGENTSSKTIVHKIVAKPREKKEGKEEVKAVPPKEDIMKTKSPISYGEMSFTLSEEYGIKDLSSDIYTFLKMSASVNSKVKIVIYNDNNGKISE